MSGLDRFVAAQADTYGAALAELKAGRKRSHWMWFVFPQIAGLGRSATARLYAIASEDEAKAYVAHDILGPRLVECCTALLQHQGVQPGVMLGGIDAIKLRSSMTLFDAIAPGATFDRVLAAFYDGERDPETLRLLAR